MNSKRSTLVLMLTIVLLLASAATAQTASGDIVGRVVDQQGGVIVGAKVTATETATGRVRNTTTNQVGSYEFAGMAPGKYQVSAESPNMAKMVATVQLLLGTHQDVNFTMKPGTAETVVEVSSEAPPIETTTSEVKANIDPRQMSELPLNGRTFASLAILAPGVRPVGSFDPTKSRIGTVSLNGSTGRNFNLSVDGGDNKDNVVGGFLQNYTTEGIQEFVIDTHKFGADTGKSAGGAVTIATKGGTNQLHGSAFIFERNKNISGQDFFSAHPNDTDTSGNPNPCPPCFTGPANQKPPFDRQNYGGSIGGPIIKNKLYFFGTAEHVHENAAVPQNGTLIQDIKDFIALRTAAPIANSVLQNAQLNPETSVSLPFRDTQWQTRVDYTVNDRNSIFVRYAQQNNHLLNDQLTGLADPGDGATTINDLYSGLINWTSTFTPNVANQMVFQYSKFFNGIFANAAGLGIPNVNFADGNFFGQNGNVPQTTGQIKNQFRDDLSWHHGNHSFKFGVQNVTEKLSGIFSFSNTPTIFMTCNPGDILANRADPTVNHGCGGATTLDGPGVSRRVLMAGGDSGTEQSGINQLGFYVQDDWKLTPRLTLNLGIRNDIDYGLVPTTDQANNRTVALLKSIGVNTGVPSTDKNNWAPRVGFAYDVTGNGNWVVRGGYGLFYDQLFQNVSLFALQASGPQVYSTIYDVRASTGLSQGISNLVGAVGPFPVKNLTTLPFGARGRFLNSDFQNPYAQHFTLGTEFSIGKNMTVAIDAVHVLSLHEFSQTDINPSTDGSNNTRLLNALFDPIYGCFDPNGQTTSVANCTNPAVARPQHRLGRISRAESNSRSRYDGLTFELKKRFSNRYQFGAAYVLSRAKAYGGQISDFGNFVQGVNPNLASLGNTTKVGNATLPCNIICHTSLAGIISPSSYGYGDQDERHRFTFNGIVELPWGFVASTIVQWSSARPYSMFADDDINGDGNLSNDLYSSVVTGDPTYDPIGEGDVRSAVKPNSLRGNAYFQTDARIQKNVKIKERLVMEVQADFFNLFNNTNFGNAFVNISDGFGSQQPADTPVLTGTSGPAANKLPRKPTALFGGGFGGAGTVGIPFQAQFGVRLRF